ncbi:hypothetical protein BBJ28_00022399 [Nothophytophthora sp. Chile5]|nr:hypothetical protein BBJ28_00022399 [Nothophytophthora sp. Chile5]
MRARGGSRYSYSQCSSRSRSGSFGSDDDSKDEFRALMKRMGPASLPLSRASSVLSDFMSDSDGSELLDAMDMDELELLKTHSGSSAGSSDDRETIRVAVRFRPLLPREKATRSAWVVQPQTNTVSQDEHVSSSSHVRRRAGIYAFDEVYDAQYSTRAIYDGLARSIARSALDGIHGSIFAYGQTSSGKTYTMQGTNFRSTGARKATLSVAEESPETEEDRRPAVGDGLVQLAVKDLFDEMARRTDAEFLVRVSYLEVYNETVRDLLVTDSSSSSGKPGDATVHVREHPVTGVFTDNSERVATDARGVLRALRDGEKQRAVAATRMNERSSRSHSIFRVVIESKTRLDAVVCSEEGGDNQCTVERVRVGCLNFVDLAGSESARATNSGGKRLTAESGNINRSLLALSKVVAALSSNSRASNQKEHINFRDSKLTRILQPSLSGAARVLFVCCASPSPAFVEDTRSTLKFATRAKRIKVHAAVNEVEDQRARALMQLARENQLLRQQMEAIATASCDQLDAMEEGTVRLRMRIASLEAAAAASTWTSLVVVEPITDTTKKSRKSRQPEVTGLEGDNSPTAEADVLPVDFTDDEEENDGDVTDVESQGDSPIVASSLLIEDAPCPTCETLDDALESAKTRELESCLRIEELEAQVAHLLRRREENGSEDVVEDKPFGLAAGSHCVVDVGIDSDETETLASSEDGGIQSITRTSSLSAASVAVLATVVAALRSRSPTEALAIVVFTLALGAITLASFAWNVAAVV